MESYIEKNKETFIQLINSIERQDFNKERLIKWLEEKSDFFTAPASIKYHSNYEGGLCAHSLNTYYSLSSLAQSFLTHVEIIKDVDTEEEKELLVSDYDEDSIKIIALFHDISKANFYEKYLRNVKNEETGKWEQVEEYRTKSADDRFIYGNHEQTSAYMLRNLIPLTLEEEIAILHHMGGMGYDSTQLDISVIFAKYPLAVLLHTADLLATYVLEKK